MKESFNADIRITSTALPDEEADLKQRLENEDARPRIRLEHELVPTEFERRATDEAQVAMTTILARLNLPRIEVPSSRIHILEDAEFREKISARAEGKTIFGHVYLRREEDRVSYCRILSHEFGHAASFYGLQVVQEADAPRQPQMWERRAGLVFKPETKEQESSVYFNGLNEGTTELIAMDSRRLMVPVSTLLDEDQKRELLAMNEYPQWVTVTRCLTELVAQRESMSPSQVRDILYTDYLTGSYVFLRLLEKMQRGSVRLLRLAGSDPTSAIKLAADLNLPLKHVPKSESNKE